jgi:hypothetical protein
VNVSPSGEDADDLIDGDLRAYLAGRSSLRVVTGKLARGAALARGEPGTVRWGRQLWAAPTHLMTSNSRMDREMTTAMPTRQ